MFARRRIIVSLLLAASLILVGSLFCRHRMPRETEPVAAVPGSSADVLTALRHGNGRFVNSARTLSIDTAHDDQLRHVTAQEQHPLAAILCCSDSRVCPEFIFDQPEGSFFEIRNAGNVVDGDVLGSLEYAIEHLHVPLVLVLGHTRCGAVKAVHEAADAPLHDHLGVLQQHMPCVSQHAHEHGGASQPKVLDQLSLENAKQQSQILMKECPLLKRAIAKGETRLICGIYDVESGAVEFCDPQ